MNLLVLLINCIQLNNNCKKTMHMGMTDTGITITISTEQKGILQFNQNSDVKKAELCVNFQTLGIKVVIL